MLSIDTITREQMISLIERENKRKQQCKEALMRFNQKNKESGELSQKREEYKLSYYKKKLAKMAENPKDN